MICEGRTGVGIRQKWEQLGPRRPKEQCVQARGGRESEESPSLMTEGGTHREHGRVGSWNEETTSPNTSKHRNQDSAFSLEPAGATAVLL